MLGLKRSGVYWVILYFMQFINSIAVQKIKLANAWRNSFLLPILFISLTMIMGMKIQSKNVKA